MDVSPDRVNIRSVRLWAVVSLLLSFNAFSFARMGIVRTADGRTLQGHIRITPARVMIVDASRDFAVSVDVTNIIFISFPTNSVVTSATGASNSLPAPWREADIGAGRIPGSTRHESGIFTVRSSGQSIGEGKDSFHFVYKPVQGDSEIVTEVVSIQYTHPSAKAGLMMRENLGEYSRNVMVALTAERGGMVQSRANEGSGTEASPPRALFAPQWLKLRRRGDEFTAYSSRNGRVWSLLEKVSVAMSTNFYVGLAVAGAQEHMLNWTTFIKVREAPKLVNEDFAPELELVSGSTITGWPQHADEKEVVFAGAPKVVRVPTPSVARIWYQPLSSEVSWKTRVSRPGVWVTSGDFFDGDFKSIQGRKLTISSVLYGLRTFDIDDEVLAVVVQPRRLRSSPFELETADGATLLATDVALGDGELLLTESALGEVRVPAFEILELRRR